MQIQITSTTKTKKTDEGDRYQPMLRFTIDGYDHQHQFVHRASFSSEDQAHQAALGTLRVIAKMISGVATDNGYVDQSLPPAEKG